MKNRFYLTILLLLVSGSSGFTQNKNFTSVTYQILPLGSIKPSGWIRSQMERDLVGGLPGHFDQINNTVDHDLFVNSDRQSGILIDNMKSWWSGEHEGYWKESLVCLAFLTDNDKYKAKAEKWINDILASTDSTGYIGIYCSKKEANCRYLHEGENGELWTQTLIFETMLAYYEYTGKAEVLKAVKKGVHLTMKKYASVNPFMADDGGVSHGIAFFNILEWLHRISDDPSYANFAVKLYDKFNHSKVRDNDLTEHNLLDSKRKFEGHGAHVAEGLFMPWFIANLTKQEDMRVASQNAMEKLKFHITPGGAMVCDENIRQQQGTADNFYEYCSNVELVNSLKTVLAYSGELSVSDMIEKLTFNALQGARLPNLKALSYLTSDNRLYMSKTNHEGRETYDSSHKAAACCALNGGRLMPFYVQGMWMRDTSNNCLVATLYGPNILDTKIDNVNVNIKEDTRYPFLDDIVFEVNPSKSKKFSICLRKPFNVENIKISGISAKEIHDCGTYIVINRTWEKSNKFTVQFDFDIKRVEQPVLHSEQKSEFYFQRGPIVYALPFPYKTDTIREHNSSKFYQFLMNPTDSLGWTYCLPEDTKITLFKTNNKNYLYPFDKPVIGLKCKFNKGEKPFILVLLYEPKINGYKFEYQLNKYYI